MEVLFVSRIVNTAASVGLITAILVMMGCVGSDTTTDDSGASSVRVDAENNTSANEQNNGSGLSDAVNATTATTGDSNKEISISLDSEIGELLSPLGTGSNDERVAAVFTILDTNKTSICNCRIFSCINVSMSQHIDLPDDAIRGL
jgi:hypothetical protein